MAEQQVEDLRQQIAAQAAQIAQLQAAPPPPPVVPQEMTDNMRDMVAEIRRQGATIDSLREQANRDRTTVQEYEVRMKELREVAAKSKSVIDSKMLNKPQNFDNKEETWPEFAFKYENWICGVEAKARLYMRWAELHEGEIIDTIEAPDDLDEESVARLDKQVYLSLAQMLSGESLDILRNGKEDCGYDAWRRLWRRWDPKTVGRNRSAYLKIAQPGVAKTVEQANKMLEQWENSIRDYEQKRKKKVDEELKCAVVVEMMPKDLRLHLQLNARTLTEYPIIRQEIMSYLEARKVMHVGQGNDPMDVDALDAKGRWQSGKDGKGKSKDSKGGKGKSHGGKDATWRSKEGGQGHSKGKDGKGKTKDGKGKSKESKGKDKSQRKEPFQGYCGHCGKWGHKREDCWARQARPAGSLEKEPGQEPEQELGGFDLCALETEKSDYTNKKSDRFGKKSGYINEKSGHFDNKSDYTKQKSIYTNKESTYFGQKKGYYSHPDNYSRGSVSSFGKSGYVYDTDYPAVEYGYLYERNECNRVKDWSQKNIGYYEQNGGYYKQSIGYHKQCSGYYKQGVGYYEQTDQELSSFDKGTEYREVNEFEYLEATVDSGAAVSVMPVDTCSDYKVVPSKASLQGVHYRAAGGHRIPDLGTRTVTVGHEGGGDARLACSVAEVKKTLLSVAKIVDRGHRVSFGAKQSECYIENTKTGERIPIRRKNDVFVIKLKVKPPKGYQKSSMLATVEQEESGGLRRATRP